jgi:hypothetical protein
MSTGINVTKPIKILDEGVLLTPDVSQIDFTGGVTATTSGNNVTVNVPAAGITVGTTPSTGIDGRVFFQAGGVVQQDANFTFDNTQKRLGLKAVGTAATDIPFVVQNSAGTGNLMQVQGDNNTVFYQYNSGLTNNSFNILNVNADTAARLDMGSVSSFNFISLIQTKATAAGAGVPSTANFRGFLYASNANGNQFVISANDGISFSSQNPNGYNTTGDQMRLKNGNLAIGTGYSASARLDIKAQGALSTDIAFRVRNSADSADLVRLNGNGTHFFFNSNGTTNINFYEYGHGIWANGGSSFRIKNLNGSTSIEGATSTRFITDVTNKAITFDGRQLHIGGQALPTINGDSCIIIESGTAPTTALSDRFYLYSADITAGNAAPHFRTENGAIVKVYQETTGVAAATLVGGGGTTITDTDTFGGYTLQQIAQALKNLGILA